jgi:chromate transporter
MEQQTGGCHFSYKQLLTRFVKIGASSFGGWSSTVLLLEKEFVETGVLESNQLKGATAYANILPGGTQVSLVANVGYQLRGVTGAAVATVSYLLSAFTLIVLFAAVYFHYLHSGQLMHHIGGLIAALSGVILANAYRIGSKHIVHAGLWLAVIAAFAARLFLNVDTVLIIACFAVGGFVLSWLGHRKRAS